MPPIECLFILILSSSAQTYDFKSQYENFEKQEKGDTEDLCSLQCVVC